MKIFVQLFNTSAVHLKCPAKKQEFKTKTNFQKDFNYQMCIVWLFKILNI